MNLIDLLTNVYRKTGILSYSGQLSDNQLSEGVFEYKSMLKTWENNGVGLFNDEIIQIFVGASDLIIGIDGNVYKCIKDHISGPDNQPISGDDYNTYWEKEDVETSLVSYFADEIIGSDTGAVFQCIKTHFSDYTKHPETGLLKSEYWKQITPNNTYSLISGDSYTLINQNISIDQNRSREVWSVGKNYLTSYESEFNSQIDLSLPENIKEVLNVNILDENKEIIEKNIRLIDSREYFCIEDRETEQGTPNRININELSNEINLYPVPEEENIYYIEMLVRKNILLNDDYEVDLPEKWNDALLYGLSARIAENYGLSQAEQNKFEVKSREARNKAVFSGYRINHIKGY